MGRCVGLAHRFFCGWKSGGDVRAGSPSLHGADAVERAKRMKGDEVSLSGGLKTTGYYAKASRPTDEFVCMPFSPEVSLRSTPSPAV